MQAVAGKINIGRTNGRIEMSQHVSDAAHLIRPDLADVSILEETFQASMTERPYHQGTVPCTGTCVKIILQAQCSLSD
jgi:hypothetical protein